jgi:hypothetical protein
LWGAGCSKEEPPLTPATGPKIVKPIAVPPKPPEPAIKEVSEPEHIPEEEDEVVQEETKPVEKVEVKEEESGYYLVKRGESLASISARGDVYGSPLNWPVIYRLNMSSFRDMDPGPDLPERIIAENLRLKLITAEEALENSKHNAENFWVINVTSARKNKEIVPPAVLLIKEGYAVYITSAQVKGKDYMRLRVGFFNTRAKAEAEGEKIKAMLQVDSLWTSKIGKEEHGKFSGYSKNN